MRFLLAFRVFFAVLFNRQTAESVAAALEEDAAAPAKAIAAPEGRKSPQKSKEAARSEALTLLAALQREGRLLDFLMEPLEGYADAQVGAAARDVHRGCREVVARMFALEPVLDQEEFSQVDVPEGFDSGVYRLTGNVAGEPPHRGRLVHQGWQASRCELPTWAGSDLSARVIAPAEVELSQEQGERVDG